MSFHNDNDYAGDLPGCCLLYANKYVNFPGGDKSHTEMISVHLTGFHLDFGLHCVYREIVERVHI